MRFTPWATRLALYLGLSATALLTACGGGGSGSNTQVRLLNATQSYAALDLSVNDKTINTKIAYANVGAYGDVDTNNTATKVLTSDVGTSVSALTPTLSSGSNYTFIAYGFAGAVRTTLLQEAETVPDSGKAKLLVLNLAPDAGTVDVYVTTATDSLDTAAAFAPPLVGGAGSGYIQLNAGTYRVRITGTTKRGADLRLDIPAVTVGSATVNTLVLTSTNGGTLVNGMQLVQKGAATSFPNALSRVRLVNALGGTPVVSASIGGNNLLPASLPPNLSEYVSMSAGSTPVAVTVNSIPLTLPAANLAAGGDYTMLIWGTAAAPQVTQLSDDNRLPAISGNVKIRLVNGLSDPASVATLNVDFTSLASNVLPGQASTPSSISPNTAGALITVNSPLKLNPLYNPATGISTTGLTTLTANSVYSVFVMGDPNATTVAGSLRKDR